MSRWTYITGVIEVETYARSTPEALYMAQTVANHLPRITGSEGDAEFYVNIKQGHNYSSNVDEFDQPSNLYDNNYFHAFEGQTGLLLTIFGKLRDRELPQTLRETTRMLNRLASRLTIESCAISVANENKTFGFNNPKWLRQIKHSDWARSLLWEWANNSKDTEQSEETAKEPTTSQNPFLMSCKELKAQADVGLLDGKAAGTQEPT